MKRRKKGSRIDSALDQGIKYARAIDAPLVFATDGVFCRAFHTTANRPPILNGEEINEFIREALALRYLTTYEVNTVSSKVQYDRKELIKVFDESNNIFRADGQERFIRSKTLGEKYTEEKITDRIKNKSRKKPKIESKRINLLIDIQNSIKAQESKGYEHWAKINNLKQASKMLNFLTEHGISNYEELESAVRILISDLITDVKNGKDYEEARKEAYIRIYQSIDSSYVANMDIGMDYIYLDVPAVDSSIFSMARKLLLEAQA